MAARVRPQMLHTLILLLKMTVVPWSRRRSYLGANPASGANDNALLHNAISITYRLPTSFDNHPDTPPDILTTTRQRVTHAG
jgi:hypothetical protein